MQFPFVFRPLSCANHLNFKTSSLVAASIDKLASKSLLAKSIAFSNLRSKCNSMECVFIYYINRVSIINIIIFDRLFEVYVRIKNIDYIYR